MSLSLERATAFLGEPNVRAFLRVIREGESSQEDSAYRMLYGGALVNIPPWRHPFYGRTTTEVGHSTAFGAYQFLGTSAREALNALGLDNDFSPVNQDLCAVWTIADKRRALADILAGNLVAACAKLKDEWVSLPGLGLERVQRVFLEYGGSLTPQNAPEAAQIQTPLPTPQPEPSIAPAPDPTPSRPEVPMLPALFLPAILQMIPSLISALGRGEQAQKNARAAEVVVQSFVQAIPGAVNEQDAIQKAQRDPAVLAEAKAKVLADPAIVALMEVGSGGIGGARKAMTDLIAASPNASWKVIFNPLLIITLSVLPLVYIVVWELVKYMGKVSPDVIAQTIGTVIGLVLGSACGFWFGQTYQSNSVRRSTDSGGQP